MTVSVTVKWERAWELQLGVREKGRRQVEGVVARKENCCRPLSTSRKLPSREPDISAQEESCAVHIKPEEGVEDSSMENISPLA